MAEFISVCNKDTLSIKPHKKSPILLRMIVLLISMLCGVCICSICLKQLGGYADMQLQALLILTRPYHDIESEQLDAPLVHYPKPQTFGREECEHNPVGFFVIISMQRSGSGWFETLLNSHANVSSNGEIFSKLERRQNVTAVVKTLDRVYNLDWLSSASRNECTSLVGFKWMLNQGAIEHHEAIADYFNRRGVSVIFLFRRNLLRRMVSVLANSYDRHAKLLNGTHKSHVHSLEEAETLSSYEPTINSTSLISDLKQVELTTAKVVEYYNCTRHIILYYEDLIKNHTKLKDVQEFLRLPVMELTSRQVKIHKRPISKQIKNFEDVNKTLCGTTYEKFLHADY